MSLPLVLKSHTISSASSSKFVNEVKEEATLVTEFFRVYNEPINAKLDICIVSKILYKI